MNNFKMIAFLEFIVNFYTFNIFIELLLVPTIALILGMAILTESKKEYIPSKKGCDAILAATGLLCIIYSMGHVAENYQLFVNVESILTFVLPPILSISFIPFFYFLALIFAYEQFFTRIELFNQGNPKLICFAKIKALQLCHLNLSRLNRFIHNNINAMLTLSSKENVREIIEKFKRN